MSVGEPQMEPHLFRRGRFITGLSRAFSVALGFAALLLLWQSPRVRPVPALLAAAAYVGFAAFAFLWQRVHGGSRKLRTAHDFADALGVGIGSYFTGGSPFWLLLYPHIVAVSVRGGLRYALLMGLFDASIVAALGMTAPPDSGFRALGTLYAVSVLWCAFMGGSVSSYLQEVQARLARTNEELTTQNQRLERAIADSEQSRREQEQALLRLSASEERYRTLLERIQDGVLIVSDGRIVYLNQVFAQMAGAPPEVLIGADFRELIPPEDRDVISERYRRFEEQHAPTGELIARMRTRQGDTLTVSLRAGALEFQGLRAVIITLRDISRERRMEQEMRAQATRLAAVNDIASAVNQSLTVDDILSMAAAEAQRIVAFDRLTIALIDEGGSGIELVAGGGDGRRERPALRRQDVAWAFRRPTSWHPSGEEPEPRHLTELLAGDALRSFASIPLLSKDRVIGALLLGRQAALPFTADDIAAMEGVVSHIAVALDNARLLEAVRRRSREFESVVEIGRRIVERLELDEILPLVTRSVNRIMGTHHCVLMLKDRDALVVGAQEGLEPEVIAGFTGQKVGESLTGWVAGEGRPLVIFDMLSDSRLEYADVVRRFGYRSYICVPLRRGHETLGTLEVVTKEPRSFSAEDQDIMTAFADQAAVAIDHARLFRATRSHVAELAAANARLAELDRLRQQYLRNVSHEFRTPLTVIRGYAEYLLSGPAPEEPALHDVMHTVMESCDRLIDMVDTLIEVSRVEQGAAAETLAVRELDLRSVVHSSVETFKAACERRHIELRLDLPQQPLRVQGDSELLHQVVRKLVDNALKYSSAGGRVVVRGRPDGTHTLLEVEDSGIGIPEEHLPRIFEKFYMVDGGLTRRVGGTGVGLYLVREILRLHGGSVCVASRPGQGSVFTVKLPMEWKGSGQTALA
jgi:PAS domain S-box-containing protein